MKKVMVAMSGGVDSSVAAALLKKQGYEVAGIFMRINDFSQDSEARAKKMAKILGIKLNIVDLRKKFKKKVIDAFLKEEKAGRTPNPCVVCNKQIKFGLLLEQAKKLGADFLATGHYVEKIQIPKSKVQKLLIAKDKNKDQSYFLNRLSQNQLKHVLFPVGDYTRQEVEKMAKDFGLPFAGVKKSMEVCFIPGTTEDFLKNHLKLKTGKIVDVDGKILGRHQGLALYTIGQRKGIGLSGGPYYVIAKNQKKNELIVSKNEKDLLQKEVLLKDVNWISGREPKMPLKAQVKIRYRSPSAEAIIRRNLKSKVYSLRFKVAQRAITPGQSAVMYRGQELLGGGIIC
jgi:tRNA-uridine 2-sulfurtransferase